MVAPFAYLADNPMRFSLLIAFSYVVAITAFARPLLYPARPLIEDPNTTFVLAAVWVFLLCASLIVHGKRGLWVLAGAPFALIWAAGFVYLYIICTYGPECL
jgi:hypothetical protein